MSKRPFSVWSFILSVLDQGGAIQQDYVAGNFKSYEHFRARMDYAARERADQFEQEQWQPIETCPRDGTPFLCGFWDRTKSDYFWITKAHWANGAVDGGWDGAREPIELVKAGYWMPLPVAPRGAPTVGSK